MLPLGNLLVTLSVVIYTCNCSTQGAAARIESSRPAMLSDLSNPPLDNYKISELSEREKFQSALNSEGRS